MTGLVPIASKWTQYTVTHRHEKRADLVCTVCHAKKIKCNLQARRREGVSDCSYCSTTGKQCQPRSSKRRKRTASKDAAASTPPTEPTSEFMGHDGTTVSDQRPITPHSHQEASYASDRNNIIHTARSGNDTNYAAGRVAYGDSHAAELGHRQRQMEDMDPPLPPPSQPMSPEERSIASIRAGLKRPSESHTGDVDTGFLQVYGRETLQDARSQALKAQPRRPSLASATHTSPELLSIFAETYFDDCYAWCPVLDRETLIDDLAGSPMLQNALALLGSHVRPPMLPNDGPAVHYDRARRIFYDDEEPETIRCLQAILLFNWWAPRSTAAVHRHPSWWWTSVVIRHAQQMSIHRAPEPSTIDTPTDKVWRRVWWTAFARERLTALCQSKPPIINCQDCTITPPSLNDFPPEMQNQLKPSIFIKWVELCGILGRIAQLLSRSTATSALMTDVYPSNVAEELISWIPSLPPQIRISLASPYAARYDKDIHQLHIPYLTAIIVLHLKRAPEPGALPLALPPAVFAASCIARIYRDILAKGDTRFLMPITSWYCGISFLALLATSTDVVLGKAAKEDMQIIVLMCDQLRKMWASAEVIYLGFERLRDSAENGNGISAHQPVIASVASYYSDNSSTGINKFDWVNFFPFASPETSETVRLLLELRQNVNYGANSVTWGNSSLLDARDWYAELQNTDFVLDDEVFQPWST